MCVRMYGLMFLFLLGNYVQEITTKSISTVLCTINLAYADPTKIIITEWRVAYRQQTSQRH